MCVSVCVLQGQKGVGRDGALALALGTGQQVVDGQLSGGEGDGRNLGLQLLEVLLLHQLVESLLLLLEVKGKCLKENSEDRLMSRSVSYR